MALPHAGSWLGLPDFGITEKIGSIFGAPQTQQGGSNLSAAFSPQAAGPTPLISPLSSSGVVGVNVPSGTSPITQTAPTGGGSQQQTQQSSGGGGSDFMGYYQGWPETAARADFQQAFGGDLNALRRSRGFFTDQERADQEAAQRRELENQINQVYNPLFQNLNQQETQLRDVEYPTALKGLESSQKQLEADLESKKQESLLGIQKQEDTLGTRQMSAMDEARRMQKALQQQSQARFGGSGSAGLAATEIGQREFARSSGKIQQQYAEAFGQLIDHRNKVDKFTLEEGARIAREAEQARLELGAELRRRLDAVYADKNQLESAKAQARLGVIQQMQSQAQALKDARTSALIQLDTWRQQQQFLIDKGLSGIQQQMAATNFQNVFQQPMISQAPTITQEPQYIASTGRRQDEFGNLVNPFA